MAAASAFSSTRISDEDAANVRTAAKTKSRLAQRGSITLFVRVDTGRADLFRDRLQGAGKGTLAAVRIVILRGSRRIEILSVCSSSCRRLWLLPGCQRR